MYQKRESALSKTRALNPGKDLHYQLPIVIKPEGSYSSQIALNGNKELLLIHLVLPDCIPQRQASSIASWLVSLV